MSSQVESKVILFDLDGTIYVNGTLFPGVCELVDKLNASKFEYAFLTNNSTIGPVSHLNNLKKLGLDIDRKNILTSAEATCLMLDELKLGPYIYILGTRKLKRYLEGRGFIHSYDRAQALLVGFDTELNYRKLTEATRLILKDIPMVATHPDNVCPGAYPDAGMLLAYFEAASPKVKPLEIAGKPHQWVVKLIQNRFRIDMKEAIMVGDRLDTDIRFANTFGMRSVLVLNGQRRPRSFNGYKPDAIAATIAGLADEYWPETLGWA